MRRVVRSRTCRTFLIRRRLMTAAVLDTTTAIITTVPITAHTIILPAVTAVLLIITAATTVAAAALTAAVILAVRAAVIPGLLTAAALTPAPRSGIFFARRRVTRCLRPKDGKSVKKPARSAQESAKRRHRKEDGNAKTGKIANGKKSGDKKRSSNTHVALFRLPDSRAALRQVLKHPLSMCRLGRKEKLLLKISSELLPC